MAVFRYIVEQYLLFCLFQDKFTSFGLKISLYPFLGGNPISHMSGNDCVNDPL